MGGLARRWWGGALILAGSLLLSGCLHYAELAPGQQPLAYLPVGGSDELAARFAPVFVVHNPHQTFNRIGRPVAGLDARGFEIIRVDPGQPAIYHDARTFRTERGTYTNLIYRVHFPGTPFSLYPFFLGAGENMGLLVLVSLDQQQRPVLVTTAGTCGCYAVSVPTGFLPAEALPADWTSQPLDIYGERLAPRLDWAGLAHPRLTVVIRPGEHRVMELDVREQAEFQAPRLYASTAAQLSPAGELTRLPLGQGHTSLYHHGGLLEGHVKGAWKPWETLLLGLVSLDGLVGMDKAYPDPDNPFYTSLKPWNRHASDLADFPAYLRFNGWRL